MLLSRPWFKRIGILFFPKSIPGAVIGLVAAAYVVYLFIDIDSHSHSVSDTLTNFVPNLMLVALVYTLIAFFTSGGVGRGKR